MTMTQAEAIAVLTDACRGYDEPGKYLKALSQITGDLDLMKRLLSDARRQWDNDDLPSQWCIEVERLGAAPFRQWFTARGAECRLTHVEGYTGAICSCAPLTCSAVHGSVVLGAATSQPGPQ